MHTLFAVYTALILTKILGDIIQMHAVLTTLKLAGASIKDIAHDRAFSGPDVYAVHAVCTVETRDHAHIAALHRALKKHGFPLVVEQ